MEILDVIDKLSNAYEQYSVLAEKTSNATDPDERIAAMHEQSVNGREIYLGAADSLKELNNLLTLEFDKETADAVLEKAFDCTINSRLDFFILEKLTKKLFEHYEKSEDTDKIINVLTLRGFCCFDLSNLDRKRYLRLAYDMYRKTIDYRENPILLSKSIYVQRILNSFFNICICCAGVDESFVPAGWEVYELFQAWLETDFFKKVRDKFPDIQGNIDQIVDNFVGAAYSGDPTCHAEEVEAIIFEKMKKAIAEERKQTPDICFDYATYLQIMAKRNPDKAKDYYYELARYYDDVISPITDPDFIGGYNTGCLGALMKLRSMADFSPKELEEEASYIKKHMLDYFRLEQAVDDNSSILTGAIPNMLFSQNIISLFKTSQEKTDVIQNMFISRHISTYMHCNMVAVFSQCIAKWALKKKPELFIGLFGISSAEAAISDSESIMAAIHRHAMLHDIGKIGIQEVVSRQYRPITDEEFQIIKLHPDGGANYLKGIPGLEDCADTARGHHRFYNGQGGYPADFDNTKSPVRLIIDIVTLSDCLDAATDYMGRNYRSVKTAAQVVDEFRASAGIRYNPDLVELMSDPDMVEELDNIASKQRKQIFIESCHASAMSLK